MPYSKEKMPEYFKNYYNNNKQYYYNNVKCECSIITKRHHIYKHRKTAKHKKRMEIGIIEDKVPDVIKVIKSMTEILSVLSPQQKLAMKQLMKFC